MPHTTDKTTAVGHTSGPWTCEIYDGEAFILNSGPAAARGITSISLKHAGLRYDESLANANLIAAAPVLLEALRYFLQQADQHAIGDIPHGLHEAARYARTAIAQATGKEGR